MYIFSVYLGLRLKAGGRIYKLQPSSAVGYFTSAVGYFISGIFFARQWAGHGLSMTFKIAH